MFSPCYEHCYLKYGKQYTKECDTTCDYAKVCLENKKLKNQNTTLFNILCPFCDKPLEIMSSYIEKDELTLILHCEECKDGIDKDWKMTCEIKSIERYFFG